MIQKYILMAVAAATLVAASQTAKAMTDQEAAALLAQGVKLLYQKGISTHPEETWSTAGGRLFAVFPLRAEDGSRCTWNYNRNWQGTKRFHYFVLNAPAAMIKVHGKKDVRWGDDEEDGPTLLQHGDIFEVGPRERCYFASRGFNASSVLRAFPNAAILLVEEGLSLDSLGISIAK
jgi:hypothetical protein